MRQLRFSARDEQSVDLALFLNGVPVFTAELKNPLNGQDVHDAIRQYREDRDPREPLFGYARCLAHFAVDPEQVFVTTRLAGPKTRFLPFNRGRFGGAGNPPVPPTRAGFPTDYLWEEVWARDSVLDLVRQFIHEVEQEDDRGRKTGARFLIFPRYQQLDCVRRLVRHARDHGAASATSCSTRPAAARASPSRGSRTGSRCCTTTGTGASSTRSSWSPTGASSTASCSAASGSSSRPSGWSRTSTTRRASCARPSRRAAPSSSPPCRSSRSSPSRSASCPAGASR